MYIYVGCKLTPTVQDVTKPNFQGCMGMSATKKLSLDAPFFSLRGREFALHRLGHLELLTEALNNAEAI